MEGLAVNELEFYKSVSLKKLQEIDERLMEIEEEYILPPHQYIDEETGLIFTSASSVEDAVIYKIQMEQMLMKSRERILERRSRIARAFNQLDAHEQEVLGMVYFDDLDYSLAVIGRLLGYRRVESFKRKIRQTLLKFYRTILHEKIDIRNTKITSRR